MLQDPSVVRSKALKGSSDVAMLQNEIKDVAGHGKQKQPLTPPVARAVSQAACHLCTSSEILASTSLFKTFHETFRGQDFNLLFLRILSLFSHCFHFIIFYYYLLLFYYFMLWL